MSSAVTLKLGNNGIRVSDGLSADYPLVKT